MRLYAEAYSCTPHKEIRNLTPKLPKNAVSGRELARIFQRAGDLVRKLEDRVPSRVAGNAAKRPSGDPKYPCFEEILQRNRALSAALLYVGDGRISVASRFVPLHIDEDGADRIDFKASLLASKRSARD